MKSINPINDSVLKNLHIVKIVKFTIIRFRLQNRVNQSIFHIYSTLNPRVHLPLQKKPPHYAGTYFFLTSAFMPKGRTVGTILHNPPFPWPYATEKSAIIYSPSKKRGVVRTWPNNALPGFRYTISLRLRNVILTFITIRKDATFR